MNVDFLSKQQVGVNTLVAQVKDRSEDAIQKITLMNKNMGEAGVNMKETAKMVEVISSKVKSKDWWKKK